MTGPMIDNDTERVLLQSILKQPLPQTTTTPTSSSANNQTTTTTTNGYQEALGLATNTTSNTSTTNPSSIRTLLKDTIFLGIDPTPDIIAIATIYFVEGALGLARLAQTYLLKEELHLGPAELSALTGIFVLPWTIKPLYGFLSDGVPLFGYKRRSYLVLAGLLGCLSYTALGQNFWGLLDGTTTATTAGAAGISPTMISATVASLIVSSACIAFSDVVADGIVVQKSRESAAENPAMAGGLQSLCWASAAMGGLLSAYFSGSLLEVMKPQEVFQITAVLPFMVASIALLIDEKPVRSERNKVNHVVMDVDLNGDKDETKSLSSTTNGSSETAVVTASMAVGDTSSTAAAAAAAVVPAESGGLREQVDALWQAIKQPSIYKPVLFLFLWQSTPTSDGAFFFFMTDELGFGPEFMGRVRVVTALASLVGVWVYNSYLKTVPIKDILFWASIAATPLGLSSLLLITHLNRELGIPDAAFVFGDDIALAVLGEIAFMPTLVLAARLCPPGVEAVLFATLMSIYNGAGTLGTEIGAGLTKYLGVTENNFDNLGLLTIICNLSSLYPLFFIGWLDEVGAASESEDEEVMELPEPDAD